MFRIRTETPDDLFEIEFLYDTCFAPGRMALSSYKLREGIAPVADLCWLARDEYDAVVGAIRYWPIRIGDAGTASLLLGPIAVHPTRQGEGLAGLLIEGTLGAAHAQGWQRVILVGDAPYYARFGFSPAAFLTFPPPTNPDRVLARPLAPGAFDGVRGAVHPA